MGAGSLTGRVAVVTGASREIGAAMAATLAASGAAVVVAHHREPERAGEVVSRIRERGGTAIAVDGDLSHVADNVELVAPFLEVDEATWDTVLGLNLKGSYFGAQAAARQMVAQGDGGRIVFSSSVTGSRAIPNLSAYAITKAGLQHMATVLALELGPRGITVNALAIGATVNERNLSDDPDYAERWGEVLPTGRVGQAADVAAALSYLVSPEAAMVTGHTLTVDGGWTGMGRTP